MAARSVTKKSRKVFIKHSDENGAARAMRKMEITLRDSADDRPASLTFRAALLDSSLNCEC
jgi:hypothetical protein